MADPRSRVEIESGRAYSDDRSAELRVDHNPNPSPASGGEGVATAPSGISFEDLIEAANRVLSRSRGEGQGEGLCANTAEIVGPFPSENSKVL